ncbi:hypothetical protein AusDCA_3801 [Desulfitobacterium sp. AusDCA]
MAENDIPYHFRIPNTEVKTSRAESTWTEESWESKSLPGKQKQRDCLIKIASLLFSVGKYDDFFDIRHF